MYIKIKSIKLNTVIGCYEYEQFELQPVEISLKLKLIDDIAYLGDDLNNTIDYDQIIKFIIDCATNTKFNLLESLAIFICKKIFQAYIIVQEINIKLTKPNINGIMAKKIFIQHKEKRKHQICLALGSNTILPQQQLITAIEILGDFITDIKISKFYETKPFGDNLQANFINCVLVGNTDKDSIKLLSAIKKIEKLMGKSEIRLNGPRIIDIDIIFYADKHIKYNYLEIPHKDMHYRDFVLVPLFELLPNWRHPILNKTITDLLNDISNNSNNIIKIIDYYK
jgi:dihydroneopterin aldolase/2-amino-4-hydroxy-6-hydroxymethyldihydropteridine diphosphokinase